MSKLTSTILGTIIVLITFSITVLTIGIIEFYL